MDELDRRILEALQNDFPLSELPYDTIAEQLGVGIDELWDRVKRLLDENVIRRMGASLDSRRLGYSSTLASVRVEAGRVDEAAEIIADFPEVTHSYLRKGDFNIWFTLIAVDEDRIETILEQIRSRLSIEQTDVLNLPVQRLFKLNARFDVSK
jgi:DNA-binding Lrp family transcriptional regulator